MSDDRTSLYKRTFRDIALGFSLAYVKGEATFIKHLGHLDQVDLDDRRHEFLQKANKRGIPTEKEVLEILIEQGDWTKEDEKQITDEENFVEQLIYNKSGLYLKSQIDNQDRLVEEARAKLNKKLKQKESLLGNTAETYADKRCFDLYIINSLFYDREFKSKYFTQETYDNLSSGDLNTISLIYSEIFKGFADQQVQELVLEDFYSPFMNMCESAVEFFGKPVCQLSHYQIKLFSYTKMFKNIFSSGEEIPHSIRKDPQKIIDWARNPKGREKAKEVLAKAGEGGAGLFGATEEDLQSLGVETRGAGTVSLQDAVRKKGGSLNMQDLMKLSGID
tara:strand:- start:98 stop:1099 length:1002 start_codon:yes stop_codon:yes gene_type:complete